MTMQVLVVGDDRQASLVVRSGLTAHGYELLGAEDGAAGIAMAAQHGPDLVVLALALPDMPGTGVIAALRTFSKVPIIALSGPDGVTDIVGVLDAGADACLTVPLDLDLFMARLRALQRRVEDSAGADEPTVLIGHYTIDLAARTVTKRPDAPGDTPQQLRLTRLEWAILEILVRNAGRLVRGEELLRHVWGPSGTAQLGHLRFHLAKLRQKLEPEPARPRQLITEPGVGYLFQP